MAWKLLVPHLLFAFSYSYSLTLTHLSLSLKEKKKKKKKNPWSISLSDLGSFLANVNATENVSARVNGAS